MVLAALEAPRQENAWRPGDQLGQWSGVGGGALTNKEGNTREEKGGVGGEDREENNSGYKKLREWAGACVPKGIHQFLSNFTSYRLNRTDILVFTRTGD